MAPSKTSAPPQNEGDTATPQLWTISLVPGKGKGVLANTLIVPGTLLISEKPLLTTEVIKSIETTEQDLAQHLRTLPKEHQRAFLSLHNNYPGRGSPLSNIIRSNGYPLGAGAEVGGIFANISRVNHSCLPNAVHTWNPLLEEETVYAVRQIGAGEEITLSYHAGGPTRERKELLKEAFGFDCGCVLCTASDEQRTASDERLGRVKVLDTHIGDPQTVRHRPFEVLRYCRELIFIYETEGIKDDRLSRLYFDLFQVTAMHSDAARAALWAKKYCEAKLVSGGKDSVDRLEMKPFMKKPQKHECFGVDRLWESKLGEMPGVREGRALEAWLWRVESV